MRGKRGPSINGGGLKLTGGKGSGSVPGARGRRNPISVATGRLTERLSLGGVGWKRLFLQGPEKPPGIRTPGKGRGVFQAVGAGVQNVGNEGPKGRRFPALFNLLPGFPG